MYLLCCVVVNMVWKAGIFRYYISIIFIYRTVVYMVNTNSFAIEKFRSICLFTSIDFFFALFLFANILYYFIIVLIYLFCYLSFTISIIHRKMLNPGR